MSPDRRHLVVVTDPGYAQPMTNYRLGLPAWGHKGWDSEYFDVVPDRLAHYARVFNTVEGNTTFYATPSAQTIASWRAQLAGSDFRACFKLPRAITHERATRNDILRFLKVMDPIAQHLGPFLVQFPEAVGPEDTDHIRSILGQLPVDIGAALELRHPDFFLHDATFDEYFEDTGCFRTIMDTRPIFLHDSNNAVIDEARQRKPRLPVHPCATNNGVLVRLVLHTDEDYNEEYYTGWSEQVAAWIRDDVDVFMMIHCADNQYSPRMARRFHEVLQAGTEDLPTLPPWPLAQQSLF
ncbi:MAG: DUF72 domain-containing protein [Pseudomonadota bacterium]